MAKPSMDSVRRACARALREQGFERGGPALHRNCGDGITATISVDGRSNGWVRAVRLTVTVYRAQDYAEAARREGMDAIEYDGWSLNYGLGDNVGRLLPRPHDHEWVVESREDVARLEQQIGELYAAFIAAHVQRWAQILADTDTTALLPGGRYENRHLFDGAPSELSSEYAQTVFGPTALALLHVPISPPLEDGETCPLAPCAEPGRGLSVGGTWPDWVVAAIHESPFEDPGPV